MSTPIAMHFDREGGVHLEREETRDVFESDPLPLELIVGFLMQPLPRQIRINYQITDLVKREDGQYIATFTRVKMFGGKRVVAS